jgi:hypothetical protein
MRNSDQGARASVYKTKILGGHSKCKHGPIAEQTEIFAGPLAKENFLAENQFCQMLAADGSSSSGIIDSWFSCVAHSPGIPRYNICFEVAEYNLKDLFTREE